MFSITNENCTSNFDNLVLTYNENKDKPWEEWLKISDIFPRPGKQGFVGILKSLNDKAKYVFKIPRYINYLTEHEFEVMNGLNDLSFCNHFCRCVGTINMMVDPTKQKGENPFTKCKKPIEKSVLLMEFLEKSFKFYNFMASINSSENEIFSIVSQVLLAVVIAQNKKKFTHYDLHSNNIMITKCNPNTMYLYVIDEENQFLVPTFGYHSTIIDFGFSYCDSLEGKPLNCSLNFTDSGFTSDRFNSVSDMKLFLITVSDEIHDFKKTKKTKKFLNIVKNNFSNLKIDWESGWDKDTSKCVNDYVIDVLHSINKSSKLFEDYEYYCMDIILSTITIPLKKQKYDSIGMSYNSFLKEFLKIEEQISSPFYCLYILKCIVDASKSVRIDYENKNNLAEKELRKIALNYFRVSILEKIDSIASYFDSKKIDFEILLCSLLCLSKNLEGMLFKFLLHKEEKKNKAYSNLFLKTPIEMLTAIELSVPLVYKLSKDTVIVEINCISESRRELSLINFFNKKEIEDLNNENSFSQAKKIYDNINVNK